MPTQTELLGGQPPLGSMASVPDLDEQVAYHRAFEAVVWAMPASAIYRFRQGLYDVPGVEDNVVVAFSGTLKSRHEAITANTALPYIAAFTDLRSGPVVVEVPAATEKASLYGQVVDAWQVTIAGVGPSGPDKGAGGKYLFIPPGHQDPIPEGYFPIRSRSYRLALAFRSVPGKERQPGRRLRLHEDVEGLSSFGCPQPEAHTIRGWLSNHDPHAPFLRHPRAARHP